MLEWFLLIISKEHAADGQTLLIETIAHYILIKKGSSADAQNFMITSYFPEPYNYFSTVTVSTHETVCLQFFQTVTSEAILQEKANVQFL